MATTYRVPQQYGGLSLKQIAEEVGKSGGYFPRMDVLASQAGLSESSPLTAGQQITFSGDPTSGEAQFLGQRFTPESTFQQQQQQAFQEEQRGRQGEFFGRLQAVPEQLEAVRQAMGIPQAFETFGAAGEQARDIASRVRGITPTQETIAKQVGISAPRLQQRIASKTAELAPAIESATRGLETGGATLENLLREFTSRTQATFAPFEIEANMLNASSQQEFDLYKTQIQSDLDRELAQISRQTTLDVAQLQRATQLAQLEDKYAGISFQDLGNRLGIFRGTELVGEQPKGRLGTLDDGW